MCCACKTKSQQDGDQYHRDPRVHLQWCQVCRPVVAQSRVLDKHLRIRVEDGVNEVKVLQSVLGHSVGRRRVVSFSMLEEPQHPSVGAVCLEEPVNVVVWQY